jgi:Zn-dependent alcohol dehydrogenase
MIDKLNELPMEALILSYKAACASCTFCYSTKYNEYVIANSFQIKKIFKGRLCL